MTLVANAHTGHGQMNLWTQLTNGLTHANCLAGTPGAPPPTGVIPVHIVRQAMKAIPPVGRDSDSDGCTDKQELGDNRFAGGLRDPMNHYDYPDPTGDRYHRSDDLLATVLAYFQDDPPGNPDMKSRTDRTAIPGANTWNLGPPNGQQRIDDILAMLKQYGNDCR
jgi:hypothetical protein